MESPLATTATQPAPSLFEIFVGFTKAGLCAVGGGLSGWMMREFVQNRGWLSEREFLSGLALAQAFPGVNVVNLSIWIGFQLRGGRGAVCAALGMILLPMFVAIAVISAFDQIAHYRLATVLLGGAAAAAIGLSLSMGVRAVRSSAVHIAPALVIVATVVALFVLEWPLLPVLAVVAPVSIGLAFWRLRAEGTRS
jgi:chromate transporter